MLRKIASKYFISNYIKCRQCQLCTQHSETQKTNNVKVKEKRESHKLKMYHFFKSNVKLAEKKEDIPVKLLSRATKCTAENLYLICPDTAKVVSEHILPYTKHNEQVICEANPGLGLISKELLEKGVNKIRFYEHNPQFQQYLKDNFDNDRTEIMPSDIFSLHYYAYRDNIDNGNRIESLLKDVPQKKWSDDPVMTIFGAMTSLKFIKHLIKSLVLETSVMKYGRVQLFAIMRPRDFAVLAASPKDNLATYRNVTILFQTFFESELLDIFSRKIFIPWQKALSEKASQVYPYNFEPNCMYLVKITTKKHLPIPFELALYFYYFIIRLYGKGTTRVIPTVESWVPNCGYNVIASKIAHGEHHFEDMSIFTQFRELTPPQILTVFKEMVNHSGYSASPFSSMIEQHMVHSETIDTDLHDSMQEKHLIVDLNE